jgi:hypothetical protein
MLRDLIRVGGAIVSLICVMTSLMLLFKGDLTNGVLFLILSNQLAET